MGTYHYLDGAKVKFFYRGNKRTCGRCHNDSQNCPGNGFAKDCFSNGGTKVSLEDHMRKIWKQVNFSPMTFSLPEDETDKEKD